MKVNKHFFNEMKTTTDNDTFIIYSKVLQTCTLPYEVVRQLSFWTNPLNGG